MESPDLWSSALHRIKSWGERFKALGDWKPSQATDQSSEDVLRRMRGGVDFEMPPEEGGDDGIQVRMTAGGVMVEVVSWGWGPRQGHLM